MKIESASDQKILDKFSLKDKVVAITGGAGDLGSGYARAFALYGAKVIITGRTQASLDKIANTINHDIAENSCFAYTSDVTNEESVRQLLNTIDDKFGRIDFLINNAGVARRHPAEQFPIEDFSLVMQTNIVGTFIPCKVFGAYFMKQGHGKIVNTSSVRGFCGHPDGYAAYAASKAAVDNLTKQLSTEWSRKGVKEGYQINVNAIAPTLIKTPLTKEICEDPVRIAPFLARLPMGRVAEVDDMVGTVMFLCSPASDYINGQIIYVDGGCVAG